MRRTAFMMMTAMCSVAAVGQGMLDCVEPDVLNGLLLQGQGGQVPVFSAAVPTEVAEVKMPAEFSWVGSAERNLGALNPTTFTLVDGAEVSRRPLNVTPASPSRVTAAWRTSLDPDAAREATGKALTAAGWELREPPTMGMAVFISAAQQMGQTACRAGQPVTYTVSSIDGVRYVLINIQRGTGNQLSVCSQRGFPAMTMPSGMEKGLPQLQLPVDPSTGMESRMSSSGASTGGGKVSARVVFASGGSAAAAAQHFAKQMADQGWLADADWNGSTSAGSTWSRREGDALYQTMLTVTSAVEGQLHATLRVVQLQ